MIAIIDYDAGNLKSVEKALLHIGANPIITRDKEQLLQADHVLLPGVGAYGEAMEKLEHYQLIETIKEVIAQGTPFLGICLGLQLLFGKSAENDGIKGLGILDGEILKIPNSDGIKIPHMGWNSLSIKPHTRLFAGIKDNCHVYFVHSFYLKAKNIDEVAATTQYSTTIHAAIERDNIFACQFHPEKSGEVGLKVLKNFISL